MKLEDRKLMELFRGMVNENRLNLIEKIMAMRTRYITVVLEDIFQPQNASAVLRTCDCFGIQDIHVIENRNTFELNTEVELGSAQWLSISNYNREKQNTETALTALRKSGYRLVATTPHRADCTLEDFDLGRGKVALLFGTEITGLSEKALEMADEYVKIPMLGFTESFNISVSAAIFLHALRMKLMDSEIQWELDEVEKEALRYRWIRNSVNHADKIEQAFRKQARQ